ncbi:hypothetical protein [Photobacterium ganghwense]|uniref:hypothetical protein n=1 Tax=Photobacterium ganghwense TaxID=320778 RepID=UPI0039F020E8
MKKQTSSGEIQSENNRTVLTRLGWCGGGAFYVIALMRYCIDASMHWRVVYAVWYFAFPDKMPSDINAGAKASLI